VHTATPVQWSPHTRGHRTLAALFCVLDRLVLARETHHRRPIDPKRTTLPSRSTAGDHLQAGHEIIRMEPVPPNSSPEAFFSLGYTDLVSVIPPGAQLTPTSKIDASQLGKVPGRKLPNGLWAGYDWRKHEPTIDDVRGWALAGANIGLRSDCFPGVDIDCTDEGLAQIIEDAALAKLGPAPLRVGRWPKRLLMYRTTEPFSRMRLWIKKGEGNHLVEILGQGQQYVVQGVHPGTRRAYSWQSQDGMNADELTPITREQADAFLGYLADVMETLGAGTTEREGNGRPITHTAAADQKALVAPSMDALREAVRSIPNTNLTHPARQDYITLGYAVRGACGDDEGEGQSVFMEWAMRWEGNDPFPAGNDAETVLSDWRRFKGPFSIGWSFIAEKARQFGYNDAQHDFDVLCEAPVTPTLGAPFLSDQWLALKVVERRRADIRYVPSQGRFLVWDGARYNPDADLLAEDLVKLELRKIAAEVERMGATDREKREFAEKAVSICSAAKAAAVLKLIQSDRQIAVSAASLDHDPWTLNTPNGMIDLKTGQVLAADPDKLCTRSTAVAADLSGACPVWKRFLAEATGGDEELEAYLQALAGYCLTGSTREQQLTFIWGPGGNGKSVFLNVLSGILGDYARTATMDAFTASAYERHSTDLAMLQGARLVTASETQAGKRWDEARVKNLTGAEPVTARFMRQDNFTYSPQFKLVFAGNHKPALRNVGEAMRRRIHLVPFTVKPDQVDTELPARIQEEWPAILAWMVEGCLRWQRKGLAAPTVVREATEQYFVDEDSVGQWLEEECEDRPYSFTETEDLYNSYRERCGRVGEHAYTKKQLAQELANRGLIRGKHPQNRRSGFKGVVLRTPPSKLV
jgi:putative DNA primase/helicase